MYCKQQLKLLTKFIETTLFVIITLYSLKYLTGIYPEIRINSTLAGIFAWVSLLFCLAIYCRKNWFSTVVVFLLFFSFGLWKGPYLEPPADPLEHLRRINEVKSISYLENSGLEQGIWHYSMASVFLTSKNKKTVSTNESLIRIHLCHALFMGTIFSIIFSVAMRFGFPARWSFVSCLIAFLFMGTNAISYFSYYSFAPTFTSLSILWLWIGKYYLETRRNMILKGNVTALCILPILMVNHKQEAAFMLFILAIWNIINCYLNIFKSRNINTTLSKFIFTSTFIVFLFIMPQFDIFREKVAIFFVRNLWEQNLKLAIFINDLLICGKFWKYRVDDTFLNIFFIMLIFVFPFFWPGLIKDSFEKKIKIFSLAFLPIILYCIPLFSFIWISNVRVEEFYRLSYVSMFWLFFIYIIYGVERKLGFGDQC